MQFDIKQITQVSSCSLNLFDVEQQECLKHNLSARKNWTVVFVLRFLQDIDLSLEFGPWAIFES